MAQVHEAAEADLSFMPYEQSLGADEVVAAYYHDLGEVQKRGNWLRFQCATPAGALCASACGAVHYNRR